MYNSMTYSRQNPCNHLLRLKKKIRQWWSLWNYSCSSASKHPQHTLSMWVIGWLLPSNTPSCIQQSLVFLVSPTFRCLTSSFLSVRIKVVEKPQSPRWRDYVARTRCHLTHSLALCVFRELAPDADVKAGLWFDSFWVSKRSWPFLESQCISLFLFSWCYNKHWC